MDAIVALIEALEGDLDKISPPRISEDRLQRPPDSLLYVARLELFVVALRDIRRRIFLLEQKENE